MDWIWIFNPIEYEEIVIKVVGGGPSFPFDGDQFISCECTLLNMMMECVV